MSVALKNPDPLVQELLEAISEGKTKVRRGGSSGNGHNGNGNGNGRHNGIGGPDDGHGEAGEVRDFQSALTHAQARTVATKVGRGMLAAATRETASHSDDVVVVARAICEVIGVTGGHRQDVLAAAHLHDIGKAAVPVEVLEKPGKLNDEEWALMRNHTKVGADILITVPELEDIAAMVRHSHERWDGGGYPAGLAGEEIPLGSRIIFCADAFHAIRSDRPYRPGRPAAEALREVRANAGTQFDPAVVEALDQVAVELRLAPAKRRVRRSSRLTALLMMLCIGGSGSAIAAGDLLGTPSPASASDVAAQSPSFQCGPFECPALVGVSIWDQLGLDPPSAAGKDSAFGPSGQAKGISPLVGAPPAGAPGQQGGGDADGPGAEGAPELGRPSNSGSGGGSANSNAGGNGKPPAHSNAGGNGGGNSNSGRPHGGPPGRIGTNPQGGPPGQTGSPPQGGPPGQTGSPPQGGPLGQLGKNLLGGLLGRKPK